MPKPVVFDEAGARRIVAAVRTVESRIRELGAKVRGATRSTFIPTRVILGRITAVTGTENATYDVQAVHFPSITLAGETPVNRIFPTTGDNAVEYIPASVDDYCVVLYPENGDAAEVVVFETVDTTDCGGGFQGAWTGSTSYVVGDTVNNDGVVYIASADHTSAGSTEPGVGASWATVWDIYVDPLDLPGDIEVSGIDGNDAVLGVDGLAGSGGGSGGTVEVKGGPGDGAGAGGSATIAGGTGGATGNGGALNVLGGAGGATSGNGGHVSIAGGTPTSGTGASVFIAATSGAGTNKDGGDITLTPGANTGSGDDGRVVIKDSGGTERIVVDGSTVTVGGIDMSTLPAHYMQVRHDTLKSSASTTWVAAAVGTMQRETTSNPFTHETTDDSVETDVAGDYLIRVDAEFTITPGATSGELRLEKKPSGGAWAEYEATQLQGFGTSGSSTCRVSATFSIAAAADDRWRFAFRRTSGSGTVFLFADDAHLTIEGPFGE